MNFGILQYINLSFFKKRMNSVFFFLRNYNSKSEINNGNFSELKI